MSHVVGIGIDVVDVPRFTKVDARPPSIKQRVFTATEMRDTRARDERLAARFAAKEATMKALGVGLGATKFSDIEIVRLPSGAPSLHVYGRASELAADLGITRWHVSLTHTAMTASAVVVGESA